MFDLPTLQKLLGRVGKLDLIRVQSKAGVPTSKLIEEIKPLLPASAQVRDVSAQVKEDKKSVSGFTSFIRYFLLAFAFIALFVGSFVIANTLSITIAQRTREFATLRTLGASRRQILKSVLVEALVIGILGSVDRPLPRARACKGSQRGVQGGRVRPADSRDRVRDANGRRLPRGRDAHHGYREPAAGAGARRACRRSRPFARVPSCRPDASRAGRRSSPAATLLVGVLLLAYGVLGHNLATGARLFSLGVGILLLFFGVAANAQRVVRPLASVLGWPATRFGGASGTLARDNAMRNPKRTASTASALMIGLALVTFVAILGQGIRSSFESAVDDLFKADYALTSPEHVHAADDRGRECGREGTGSDGRIRDPRRLREGLRHRGRPDRRGRAARRR